jgi:hypothetical protein
MNDRLPLRYAIQDFDSDTLRVQVDAPAGAWMLYLDRWSPEWEATVNGAPRGIAKANFSDKAVRLEEGRNVVEFRCRSPLRTAAFLLVGLNALLWLLWTFAAAARLASRGGRA